MSRWFPWFLFIVSSVFLVRAILEVLALRWPRLAAGFLGRLSPDQFTDPHLRRLAIRRVWVSASSGGLLGSGMLLLLALRMLQPISGLALIGVVIGMICVISALGCGWMAIRLQHRLLRRTR
jgi:hypothetical protein